MNIIQVQDPQLVFNEAQRDFIHSSKKIDLLDFDFLDECKRVQILPSFSKFVPKEQYSEEGTEYYSLESQSTAQRFSEIEDGYADIQIEVRSVEGVLKNKATLGSQVKIHILNPDDTHYYGFHLALLFMKNQEESWFWFDDAYTMPRSFLGGYQDESQYIPQLQGVSQVYKIKLIGTKLQKKQQEVEASSEQQSTPKKEKSQITVEELETKLAQNIAEQEEKLQKAQDLFNNKEYNKSAIKFQKLASSSEQLFHIYKKSLDSTNPSFIKLINYQIELLMRQIESYENLETPRWVKVDEISKQVLQIDPNHQRSHFYQAKSLFNLAYFDKAETLILDYIKRFPEDKESKQLFDKYLEKINARNAGLKAKEKKMYEKMFKDYHKEETREKYEKNQKERESDLILQKKAEILQQAKQGLDIESLNLIDIRSNSGEDLDYE